MFHVVLTVDVADKVSALCSAGRFTGTHNPPQRFHLCHARAFVCLFAMDASRGGVAWSVDFSAAPTAKAPARFQQKELNAEVVRIERPEPMQQVQYTLCL